MHIQFGEKAVQTEARLADFVRKCEFATQPGLPLVAHHRIAGGRVMSGITTPDGAYLGSPFKLNGLFADLQDDMELEGQGRWLWATVLVSADSIESHYEWMQPIPATPLNPHDDFETIVSGNGTIWVQHYWFYDRRKPEFIPQWWKTEMASVGGWDLTTDRPTLDTTGQPTGTPQTPPPTPATTEPTPVGMANPTLPEPTVARWQDLATKHPNAITLTLSDGALVGIELGADRVRLAADKGIPGLLGPTVGYRTLIDQYDRSLMLDTSSGQPGCVLALDSQELTLGFAADSLAAFLDDLAGRTATALADLPSGQLDDDELDELSEAVIGSFFVETATVALQPAGSLTDSALRTLAVPPVVAVIDFRGAKPGATCHYDEAARGAWSAITIARHEGGRLCTVAR